MAVSVPTEPRYHREVMGGGRAHLHVLQAAMLSSGQHMDGAWLVLGAGESLCGHMTAQTQPASGERACPRCAELARIYGLEWPASSR